MEAVRLSSMNRKIGDFFNKEKYAQQKDML